MLEEAGIDCFRRFFFFWQDVLDDGGFAAQDVIGGGAQAQDGVLRAFEREVVRCDEALDHELDVVQRLFRIESVR